MSSQILVPKSLRENSAKRLFSLEGLNREARRRTKLPENRLVESLLNPSKRLWRFWCAWWPLSPNGAPTTFPSIDYLILREFQPDLKTIPFDPGSIETLLKDIGVDVEAIPEKIKPNPIDKYEFSFAPFSVWSRAKAGLQEWDGIGLTDQQTFCEVIFALDGISGSNAFSQAAEAIAPECMALFEKVSIQDDFENEDSEGSIVQIDSSNQSHQPKDWSGLWLKVSELARSAQTSPISLDFVSQVEALLREIKSLADQENLDRQNADRLLEDLRECLSRHQSGLIKIGFGQISSTTLDAIVDAVQARLSALNAPELRTYVEDTKVALHAITKKTEDLEAFQREKEGFESALAAVEAQLLSVTHGNRIALIRNRNDLRSKIGDVDVSIAESEGAATELLRKIRGEGSGNSAQGERDGDESARDAVKAGAKVEGPADIADAGRISQPSVASTSGSIIGKAVQGAFARPSPTEIVDWGGAKRIGHGQPAPSNEKPEDALARATDSPKNENVGTDTQQHAGSALDKPVTAPQVVAGDKERDPFSDESGERCRPIWRALRSNNPALAFQIARSLELLDSQLRVPPVPLLKAVALAGSVRFSHGELAQSLGAAYELLDRAWFETGPSEWREALSILLVAGTLKPSLVTPDTGATAVIRYAHPPRKIHELRQLVVEVGERLQGLNLGPTAFREVGGIAGWEQEWASYKVELADWRSRAASFTMRFGRANDVWRQLISNQGRIGALLSSLDGQNPPTDGQVARFLNELSDATEFRKLINHVDREILGARRGPDIQAGAFKQLEDRSGDALELAQRWLDLQSRMPKEGNFVLQALESFRNSYGKLRAAVESELSDLESVGTRWHLTASAVACMRTALGGLDELLKGHSRATELTIEPERLLAFSLFQSASIQFDENWQPAQSAEEVLKSALALVDVSFDWNAAFDARMALGDGTSCRAIVSSLDDAADPRADQFRRRLDQGLESWRNRLRVRLVEARKRLESALAYGYIGEPERGHIDAQLASTEGQVDQVGRFQEFESKVDEIVASLKKRKAERLDSVAREVAALRLDESTVPAQKLRAVVEAGDVFTANEYLQRIRAGESLPDESGVKEDVFREFFPEHAGKIESLLDQGKLKYSDIRSALTDGKIIECLDFSSVGRDQRGTASSMLDAWFALKRATAGQGDRKSIGEVIEGLGFSGAKLTVQRQGRDRMECEISGQVIADRNICPVAAFGSQAQGRYRVIVIWGQPADEDLPRIVGDSASSQPTVVLYLGRQTERGRRELARVTRTTGAGFLVLDEILMLHLCTESGSRLGTFFACSLPFSCVRPFVTTSGLVPPEMFFGRTGELKAVTDRNGRCFVYGGRQLGKTALLRTAERLFHQPAQRQFAAWIDLKAAGIGSVIEVGTIWAAIRRKLVEVDPFFSNLPELTAGRKQSMDQFLDDLRRRFAPERGARLLLLLDEADRFLEQDSRTEYHETGRLKNLMDSTGRGFKVVFAGLHNVLRTTEQANHPLAHFGDPIEIGPFTGASEWNEARSMIRGPLLAAGYHLASDDLIVRILAQTNYYPVLIQLYGEQLVRILQDTNRQRFAASEGPRYPISDAVVDEAYRERSLREAIQARFKYTLQLDQRYEVIAYALALDLAEKRASFATGIGAKELRDSALYWWGDGFRGVSDHEFRIILDEMVGLGVLRRIGERMYSLRNPNLLRLLGTLEDIETVLTRDREAPVEFEPSVFRASDPAAESSPRRSPLTFTQESSLFADRHGVSLIVGTEAAGLRDLEHFLTRRIPGAKWRTGIANKGEFGKLLDARREEGHTVVVLPPDVPWGEDWIRQALEKTRKLTSQDRRMRVVFVADPVMLWQMLSAIQGLTEYGLEVVSLKPWNERFVRQWLGDIQVSGDDPTLRSDLNSLTGLWPGALMPLPARCHQLADLVSWQRKRLDVPANREQLLNALGLPPGEARNSIQLLQAFPDEPLESLRALGPEMDVPAERIGDRMRWAEMLQIVQSSGKDCWRVTPPLNKLLDSTPNA